MSDQWVAFLSEIDQSIKKLDEDGCDFPVFRGHSTSAWNLEPSLFRCKKYLDSEDFERLESALYFDFVTYSAKSVRFESTWEVLFEMRHHGLPTRLLDWSESFAVALYFALTDQAPSPTIWILDPYKLNEISMKDSSLVNPITGLKFNYESGYLDLESSKVVQPFELDIAKKTTGENIPNKPFVDPIAIVPPLSSDRLFAQKGLFTLQGLDDQPFNLSEKFSECIIKKEVPLLAIPDARTFIQLSGVNEFSIFPDMDGLSRYLSKKYKVR